VITSTTHTTPHGDILELSLARPDKRNALTPEMLTALRDHVTACKRSSARVLLLSGQGHAFCAGFDLSLCKDHPDGSVMRALLSGLHDCIDALRSPDIPVVIAAHGSAIAGGCALLGGGDIILTNAQAKIGYPVPRLGVSPAVSAPFLRNLTHDGNARARLLENTLIDGRTALRLGLAHECLDTPEAVHARALAIAADLASKPAAALAATKRWLTEISPILNADKGLQASLTLTGGEEERRLLPQAWSRS
jgi:2-(1,2-epoxy-1,2-dihydrophenyl)acetyl-CoA isomerase